MLFLHAGTPKTGTTYLQKTFHLNRGIFVRHGLTYLPVYPFDLTLPRYANAKFLYDQTLAQEAGDSIRSASTQNVLISEEGIFGDIGHLENPVFAGLNRKIIIYVRPAAEVLSAWAAELTNPYNVLHFPGEMEFHPANRQIPNIDLALNIASHEYALSLGRFMNVVDKIGPEQFIVRPYERASFIGKSLLADFLTQLGINESPIRADPDFCDPGPTNPSPSRLFCDVSHSLWHKFGQPDNLSVYNFDSVTFVADNCSFGDTRPVIETLTDQQIEWYTNRFHHFESYISRTFFDGMPLFKNRYTACYGTNREPYQAINTQEIDLLANLRRLRSS